MVKIIKKLLDAGADGDNPWRYNDYGHRYGDVWSVKIYEYVGMDMWCRMEKDVDMAINM